MTTNRNRPGILTGDEFGQLNVEAIPRLKGIRNFRNAGAVRGSASSDKETGHSGPVKSAQDPGHCGFGGLKLWHGDLSSLPFLRFHHPVWGNQCFTIIASPI